MQCPKCQSNNALLCSMAYEQGTSITQTKGVGSGHSVGYSAQGGFGVAQHNVQTTSTSKTQTPFAKRAEPPTNWFGLWAMNALGSGVAVVVVYFLHGLVKLFGIAEIVAVPWLVVALVGLLLTFPGRHKYKETQRRWEASWICAACGNIFVPDAVARAN